MISYKEPKQIEDGYYLVKAFKENGDRYLVQLNNVTLMSSIDDASSVVFGVSQSASKVQEVDDFNTTAAKTNSALWFGKELSQKTLEAAYIPSISSGEMKVFKVKSTIKVFSHTKEEIDQATVTEGTVCDAIMEFYGLRFTKKSFYAVWRVVQLKCKAPPKIKYHEKYLFEDDQADGNEDSGDDIE